MTAFDIYHSLTTSAQSKTNEKPLCWARCPGLLRVIRDPDESTISDLEPNIFKEYSFRYLSEFCLDLKRTLLTVSSISRQSGRPT